MNAKKIGLTALAGSLIASSAIAADLSVTGGASFTLGNESKKQKGNGFSMGDSVTIAGSADMDNGWTVSTSFELDGGANTSEASSSYDSVSMTVDMGDAGKLTFASHGGSNALGAKDDVMPTAHEEPWDILTSAETNIVGGVGTNNMFNYQYSAEGFTGTISYVPSSGTTNATSTIGYGVEFTGVEGATIGFAMEENEQTQGTAIDESTMYAKYAIGPVTVGYQVSSYDHPTASSDYDTTGAGISFAVNDDLSVSYGIHEVDKEGTATDQETAAVSASYTMGSFTVGASFHTGDNISNSTYSTNDREAYDITLTFAF